MASFYISELIIALKKRKCFKQNKKNPPLHFTSAVTNHLKFAIKFAILYGTKLKSHTISRGILRVILKKKNKQTKEQQQKTMPSLPTSSGWGTLICCCMYLRELRYVLVMLHMQRRVDAATLQVWAAMTSETPPADSAGRSSWQRCYFCSWMTDRKVTTVCISCHLLACLEHSMKQTGCDKCLLCLMSLIVLDISSLYNLSERLDCTHNNSDWVDRAGFCHWFVSQYLWTEFLGTIEGVEDLRWSQDFISACCRWFGFAGFESWPPACTGTLCSWVWGTWDEN